MEYCSLEWNSILQNGKLIFKKNIANVFMKINTIAIQKLLLAKSKRLVYNTYVYNFKPQNTVKLAAYLLLHE